jgi:hypothetical protein
MKLRHIVGAVVLVGAMVAPASAQTGSSPLGAFQCYGARVSFGGADVDLVDRFGTYAGSLDKLSDVCAPSSPSTTASRRSRPTAKPIWPGIR